jgi:hypothetical protein
MDGGTVVGAIVLDIMDGSIVGVQVVRNPDKLARLSARGPHSADLADLGDPAHPARDLPRGD